MWYPAFLSYRADLPARSGSGSKLGEHVACIARLDATGCGIRQPLEAALKAVWPSRYLDAAGSLIERNPCSSRCRWKAGTASGQGWYYDNFWADALQCRGGPGRRIAFTDEAQPPAGVRVVLSCEPRSGLSRLSRS